MPVPSTGVREYYRNDRQPRCYPPSLGNIPLIEWRRLAEARRAYRRREHLCSFAQPAGTSDAERLRDAARHRARRSFFRANQPSARRRRPALPARRHGRRRATTTARATSSRASAKSSARTSAIGVELDLHCHLTDDICDNADAIVVFKEYPHIDATSAPRSSTRSCPRRSGKVRPVVACTTAAWSACGARPSSRAGASSRACRRSKADGILSVSFGHGFPWGDVAEVGAKVVVVADNDSEGAALAAQLGQEIWEMRAGRDARTTPSTRPSTSRWRTRPAPIVLADVADNAGGGAPGDSTFILRRLVERGVKGAAIGCFWDPVAVAFCRRPAWAPASTCASAANAAPLRRCPSTCTSPCAASSSTTPSAASAAAASIRHRAPGSRRTASTSSSSGAPPDLPPEAFAGLGRTLADKRHRRRQVDAAFLRRLRADRRSSPLRRRPGRRRPRIRQPPVHAEDRPYWAARRRSLHRILNRP